MSRINHIKIVTPDPGAVDAFLQSVAEIPGGWSIPRGNGPDPLVSPGETDGPLTHDLVHAIRGADGVSGLITGDERTRQFQILSGDEPHIWSVAIGIRDLEAAHERAVAGGYEVTDLGIHQFGEGTQVRFFFARVAGVLFEMMRVEPAGTP